MTYYYNDIFSIILQIKYFSGHKVLFFMKIKMHPSNLSRIFLGIYLLQVIHMHALGRSKKYIFNIDSFSVTRC